MAINLASKFAPTIDKAFEKGSFLKRHCKGKIDFTGVKTVRIYGVNPVEENDYKRSGTNRYGEPQELEDTVQEHTLSQDKAFTFTIDKGNQKDQMNIKGAAEMLKMQLNQKSTPNADKYGFKRLCTFGHIGALSAKPPKATIVSDIADGMQYLDDHLVPDDGRVLFVTSELYKFIILADEFVKLDSLGGKSIPKGTVGTLLGMPVVKVPGTYLPDGCYFIILYEGAACFPYKIQDTKIHEDPMGLSGNAVEGRHYYDLFVFEKKADGIYCGCLASKKQAAPTITDSTKTAVTLASSGAGKIWYTLDGSDPRFSANRELYAGAFNGTGKTVKAVAMDTEGKFTSDVAEKTVAS